MTSSAKRPLDVVVLCSANRFRSPIAARAFRSFASPSELVVSSFAVFGESGRPPVGAAQAIAADHGLDIAGHSSCRLAAGTLMDADLVVGFEAVHVSAAVVDGGAKARSTFLFLELHQLLSLLPTSSGPPSSERARQILARIDELRTGDWFAPALQFADPIEGPRRGYEPAIRRIVRCSDDICRALFGSSDRHPTSRRRRSLA